MNTTDCAGGAAAAAAAAQSQCSSEFCWHRRAPRRPAPQPARDGPGSAAPLAPGRGPDAGARRCAPPTS
eukprot:scaffold21094_cov110-Isochrysis_galbana.AAC.5